MVAVKNLSTVKISVLDLVNYAQNQTIADAFQCAKNLAQQAEKWGYYRYWMAEHHGLEGVASAATSILIGYIAENTKTIRVGSGGIMLPNHAPMMVAEQFGTLETLYPGRIDLGLGRAPGSDQLTMRALRRGLSSQGDDFPDLIEELLFFFGPDKPDKRIKAIPGAGLKVPMWILGSSHFSAHLAARLGFPYAFASHFAPAELYESLSIYRNEFQPSEHLSAPKVMVGVPVIAAETDERANYLSTSLFQRFTSLVRGKIQPAKPPVESMEGLWSPQEQAYAQSMLKLAVIGGPEKVKAGLEKIVRETQADELIITSDNYYPADKLRSYEIIAQCVKHV